MRISRRISAEIFRKIRQHGELHFPHEIDEKWSAGSALDRREKRDEGGLDAGSKFCDEDALGKARLGHRADPLWGPKLGEGLQPIIRWADRNRLEFRERSIGLCPTIKDYDGTHCTCKSSTT